MELAGSKEFSEGIFILIECLNAEKPGAYCLPHEPISLAKAPLVFTRYVILQFDPVAFPREPSGLDGDNGAFDIVDRRKHRRVAARHWGRGFPRSEDRAAARPVPYVVDTFRRQCRRPGFAFDQRRT
jgi:hypothetical protein